MKRCGFILTIICLVSCSSKIHRTLTKNFSDTERKFQDHAGFALFDIAKKKTVFEYNADKYFTPASNTKVLTLFTCFTILGDSLPALKYLEKDDSLIFFGMGDPSFLNEKVFQTNRVYNFLKGSTRPLYFSADNFYSDRYGSGWAWDDYAGSYQAERSPLPIYGNLLKATLSNNELLIEPPRFATRVLAGETKKDAELLREEVSNDFVFHPSLKANPKEFFTPFIINDSLLITLIMDTLHREVKRINQPVEKTATLLFGTPADSVYKVMMQESDNFLAEQLLLMCSAVISDSLKAEPAIRLMQQTHLADVPDKLMWVDGSGLSRYNLFTPRSMVSVWRKLYDRVPSGRLLPLLATGGVNGTVKNWYKSDSPYIFGKTGTLANNHSLSGYLMTRSGKTLIFSFMNSNFLAPTSDIRRNMQQILEYIRDNY